jgi:DNA-binding XRE family transcriptional regulator
LVDSKKLDELIRESGKKKMYLAEKCGITRQSFDAKRSGKATFTLKEAQALIDELNISDSRQVVEIFFA